MIVENTDKPQIRSITAPVKPQEYSSPLSEQEKATLRARELLAKTNKPTRRAFLTYLAAGLVGTTVLGKVALDKKEKDEARASLVKTVSKPYYEQYLKAPEERMTDFNVTVEEATAWDLPYHTKYDSSVVTVLKKGQQVRNAIKVMGETFNPMEQPDSIEPNRPVPLRQEWVLGQVGQDEQGNPILAFVALQNLYPQNPSAK